MAKRFFIIAALLLLTAGCGVSSKLRSAQERTRLRIEARKNKGAGPSLAVGGQTIDCDQIVEWLTEQGDKLVPLAERLRPIAADSNLATFKAQAEPYVRQVLLNRIFYILLYNQAKKDLGDNIDLTLEKETENQLREYVASEFNGDYAAARRHLEEQGGDWEYLKELRKKLILIASRLPEARPITYSELLQAYDRLKDGFLTRPATITIRLIDIQVPRTYGSDPNHSRLEAARALANHLMGRLDAGEGFAELASRYSHGHRKAYGGLWKPRQPESLAAPYDILAAKAELMRPGEISGPIETQDPQHIFIMKLEDKSARRACANRQIRGPMPRKNLSYE
ncbi:MAG: peptidylprolyl isomerase [Planctomycetota bacterium]